MHFTTIAQILGIMGLTPVRAFLPAFLSAVILRIGGIPYLSPVVEGETALAPTWFTHDITILVLGILALAELFATKSPELRSLLETLDQYDKPVLAVITVLGILSYTDAAAVQVIHGRGFSCWRCLRGLMGGGSSIR